jgi:hypothetical protein
MISTTSSTNPTLLGWQGWNSSSSQPTSSETDQSVSAEKSGSTTLAEVLKELRNLRAKVDAQKTNPVAGLSAGMINPLMSSTGSPFGMANPLLALNQGLPITGMASAGTPFPSQQGGAVDSSIPTGSVISPGALLA